MSARSLHRVYRLSDISYISMLLTYIYTPCYTLWAYATHSVSLILVGVAIVHLERSRDSGYVITMLGVLINLHVT